MKIKTAVEARVSADRKRCLGSCQGHDSRWDGTDSCALFDVDLRFDSLGRPLRCAECLKNEVKP